MMVRNNGDESAITAFFIVKITILHSRALHGTHIQDWFSGIYIWECLRRPEGALNRSARQRMLCDNGEKTVQDNSR